MAKKQLFAFLFLGIFLEFWVVATHIFGMEFSSRKSGKGFKLTCAYFFKGVETLKPPTRKLFDHSDHLYSGSPWFVKQFPFYQLGRE